MTVLLAKAAAMALAQHPVVNSTCKDGKSFTYNSSINIAVAVSIDGGLITPVLQDADKVRMILRTPLEGSSPISESEANGEIYAAWYISPVSKMEGAGRQGPF